MNGCDEFRMAIHNTGLTPPESIEADGKLHRFASNGKRNDDAGWYIYYPDGIPAGAFGSWREGIKETWRADIGRALSSQEDAANKARVEAMWQARKADNVKRKAETREKAAEAIEAAKDDPALHPYAIKKSVPLGPLVKRGAWPQRGWQDALLIPIYGPDGELLTLQAINVDGGKDYLKGGSTRGGYHPFGEIRGARRVFVAEGAVNAAVGFTIGNSPAAAAMDAGNLKAAAINARKLAPDAEIIFLCDNDIKSEGPNVGLSAAMAAARAVGGRVAVPDLEGRKCDLWDIWHERGPEAVQQAIADAIPPPPEIIVANVDTNAPAAEQSFEPEPLWGSMVQAEAYPVDALGDILGGAATAIHDAVKAPLAMCCQSVLVAASLAAQAHYNVKLPWGESKPLSLFVLTVGESGERKSAVDDLVLGAAKAQERAEMEEYVIEQKSYELKHAAWMQATEAARKAITNAKKGSATAADVLTATQNCGEKPIAPIAPLRFVTDPTVEGLYKLLVIGQPSVGLFSDEGGLLIGGHALNSDNALKTMARWCKIWDGSPFDRVRAGDGAGILYGRRMALHQLAQPDVMALLLSDKMANGQGFLARCLPAWPQSTIGTRHVDGFEWAGNRRELKRLFAVLKGLMEAEPVEQELNPIDLPLTDSAIALAIAANNAFETLMESGATLADLRDRTSKALEQACRLAGVIAVIEGGLTTRAIDKGHLERGLVLIQWYLAEALRIREAATVPESISDAELLITWLRERGTKQFKSALVLQSGPNSLRSKDRFNAAILELVAHGHLIENEKGTVIDGVAARKSWRVLDHVV